MNREPPYGLVSTQATPHVARFARCSVDGVDVTKDCCAANDIEGWAEYFARDSEGRIVLDKANGGVAKKILRGHVVITFPDGFPD